MSEEYIPTTDEVRKTYDDGRGWQQMGHARYVPGEFDRWLETVRAEIKAEALDALKAVLDRARMEQDDADCAMAYAATINDGLMLASQQARKQAWADAARAITTALEAS